MASHHLAPAASFVSRSINSPSAGCSLGCMVRQANASHTWVPRALLESIFMFVGLEHTAIASPSPAKLARWYVDHLGFRINFEYDGNYFVRAANGSLLEIISSDGGRGDHKMHDPRLRHPRGDKGEPDAPGPAAAGARSHIHPTPL